MFQNFLSFLILIKSKFSQITELKIYDSDIGYPRERFNLVITELTNYNNLSLVLFHFTFDKAVAPRSC